MLTLYVDLIYLLLRHSSQIYSYTNSYIHSYIEI